MSRKKNNFVADGRIRLLEDPETKKAISEIEKQVEQEYAQRLSEAGWLGRQFLKMVMNKEIRERVGRIAPSDALYIVGKKEDS